MISDMVLISKFFYLAKHLVKSQHSNLFSAHVVSHSVVHPSSKEQQTSCSIPFCQVNSIQHLPDYFFSRVH